MGRASCSGVDKADIFLISGVFTIFQNKICRSLGKAGFRTFLFKFSKVCKMRLLQTKKNLKFVKSKFYKMEKCDMIR